MKMPTKILSIQIRFEDDVILSRQRSREIAGLIGFTSQDQTRITTAVSELARNVYQYAGDGKLDFQLDLEASPQMLCMSFEDQGPGIADLEAVLKQGYASKSGLGIGLAGARRLMDHFEIDSRPGQGTRVLMGKALPEGREPWGPADIQRLTSGLAAGGPRSAFAEVQQQNQDLLQALDELRAGQEELTRVNTELKEKKQELEKANQRLEEAGRLKSQFMANMSHELRSPLNSIIGFSGIILEGLAGELNAEQKKQLNMVYGSAQHLLGLINDVLDLSKIEAGKIEIQPAEFDVQSLVDTVQGMFSPLVQDKGLNFFVNVADGVPSGLYNDKNRIKQVLINMLSNAVKFTSSGRIELRVEPAGPALIRFSVSDTGLGIRPEHLEEVFDEFKQIDGPLKEKPGGTGLGLAICKKMVEMMGGSIGVNSEYGQGSCFFFNIPVQEAGPAARPPAVSPETLDQTRKLILTIDDELEAQEILTTYLQAEGYEVIQAYNGLEALQLARKFKPFAVTLDIVMPGRDGWDILEELKNDPETENIPVICISILDNRELGLSLGAVEYLVKPIDKDRLTRELDRLKKMRPIFDILIVDDDARAVELLSRYLEEINGYRVRKAYGGQEGLDRVSEQAPDLIILDLMMPEVDGFEVIGRLKQEEPTKHIPIIIVSGKKLTQEEVAWLNSKIENIIQKQQSSREDLLRDIKKALGEGGRRSDSSL
ncbi:MAG: response regulator [Desulfohalobiaceae bacterium]|nr:response regulator [Desulfohalobiaceae bacterium]